MAESDAEPSQATFAGRLAHVLKRDGVSNSELGRRLAGPDATDKQAENQRTGVLRWRREGVEPEPESARAVEVALGLDEGYLVSVLKPKPRGRPAQLTRAQELAELRSRVDELEQKEAARQPLLEPLAAAAGPAERLGDPPRALEVRLLELEEQAGERARETKDLARLVAGLTLRVGRLEGRASQRRGGSS